MDSEYPDRLFHILGDSPFFHGLSNAEKRRLAGYLLRMYPRLKGVPEFTSESPDGTDYTDRPSTRDGEIA